MNKPQWPSGRVWCRLSVCGTTARRPASQCSHASPPADGCPACTRWRPHSVHRPWPESTASASYEWNIDTCILNMVRRVRAESPALYRASAIRFRILCMWFEWRLRSMVVAVVASPHRFLVIHYSIAMVTWSRSRMSPLRRRVHCFPELVLVSLLSPPGTLAQLHRRQFHAAHHCTAFLRRHISTEHFCSWFRCYWYCDVSHATLIYWHYSMLWLVRLPCRSPSVFGVRRHRSRCHWFAVASAAPRSPPESHARSQRPTHSYCYYLWHYYRCRTSWMLFLIYSSSISIFSSFVVLHRCLHWLWLSLQPSPFAPPSTYSRTSVLITRSRLIFVFVYIWWFRCRQISLFHPHGTMLLLLLSIPLPFDSRPIDVAFFSLSIAILLYICMVYIYIFETKCAHKEYDWNSTLFSTNQSHGHQIIRFPLLFTPNLFVHIVAFKSKI